MKKLILERNVQELLEAVPEFTANLLVINKKGLGSSKFLQMQHKELDGPKHRLKCWHLKMLLIRSS